MTIRPARIEEVDDLVALCLAFFTSTGYYDDLVEDASPESLHALIVMLFGMEDKACLLVAEDREGIVRAGIGLIEVPHPLSGELYADELVWFTDPRIRQSLAGPQLHKAGEAWAESRKIGIKMVAPMVRQADGTYRVSEVGGYYERRGYRPIETAYFKAAS